MSPEIPQFKHQKHSSAGRDERIDWIVSKLKKYSCYNERIPSNSNIVECKEKIHSCCRLLRMGSTARSDYTTQVLLELGITKN